MSRGASVGELARLYCLTGSDAERRVMLDAIAYHALPAHVTIACGN